MKIETKPTIWHITLAKGCYSDYWEYHHFVKANDRDEAIFIFKQFVIENRDEKPFKGEYGIVFSDTTERFQFRDKSGRELDWEPNYGDAMDCDLEMLKVIYP